MITHTLEKRTCLNPYYIAGNQVELIHFFGDGEIIATNNRGWLPMYGSNSSGNNVLEAIEFRRKRKPDLTGNYSFSIGSELYVNIAELPEFLYAPDVVELKTKDATYYGNRIYFVCGSTDGRLEHLENLELRSFMIGSYSDVILTDRGQKVVDIVQVFADSGIKMPSYDAAKILDNANNIIKVMGA